MFKAILSTAALATVLSASLSTTAVGQAKEKCYGIAEIGKNDCGNLAGTHSCAGQSTVDKDPGEWKYVAKGECAKLKGLSKIEAEAAIKAKK